MGVDDSGLDRLLAGAAPSDDAELGQVSAFLSELKAAYPLSSVAAVEDHHLAVIAHEVRAVGASRLREHRDAQRSSRRLRRTFAAFAVGLLAVLTAGAGVASAMGLNPLEYVPGLIVKPSATPSATALTREPTPALGGGQDGSQDAATPSADPSTPPTSGPPQGAEPPSAGPSAPPTMTGQPEGAGSPSVEPASQTSAPQPTIAGNCGSGKREGNAGCTKDKPGKEKPGKQESATPSASASASPSATSDKGKGSGKDAAGPAGKVKNQALRQGTGHDRRGSRG